MQVACSASIRRYKCSIFTGCLRHSGVSIHDVDIKLFPACLSKMLHLFVVAKFDMLQAKQHSHKRVGYTCSSNDGRPNYVQWGTDCLSLVSSISSALLVMSCTSDVFSVKLQSTSTNISVVVNTSSVLKLLQ